MADLIDLSLAQMGGSLRTGEFSSQELTRAFIERIERLEPDLHAFITLTPELAMAQAKQADRCLSDWRKNPAAPLSALLGVPLAVKDILCVSGVRCTCGSRILENFVPPYSATAVKRLLAAGAILLGKTNTDEEATRLTYLARIGAQQEEFAPRECMARRPGRPDSRPDSEISLAIQRT